MAASRSPSVGSIDPGRVEGGVAEQLGDGDDVGAGVDQVGTKGMAQDVRGDQLGQAGRRNQPHPPHPPGLGRPRGITAKVELPEAASMIKPRNEL